MPLTKDSIGQTALDTFVEIIPAIYSNHDAKRDIMDVWFHASHHAAAIGEEVRKSKPGGKLLEEIADFAMWFFTLLGKLEGDLGVSEGDEGPRQSLMRVAHPYSDLLWNKYPGLCPVCYWRRTGGDRSKEEASGFDRSCDCLLYDVEKRDQSEKKARVEALRAFATSRPGDKPASVDDWQRMFGGVFGSNLRHLDMTDIAFHLLEELGEVSDAMVRMYTYKEEEFLPGEVRWRQIWLEEELADVSSWLFALVEKANWITEIANEYDRWRLKGGSSEIQNRARISLSGIVWTRYGSDDLETLYCPFGPGQAQRCTCEILFVPEDISVEAAITNFNQSAH